MAAQVTATHDAAERFLLQMATRAQAHGVSTKTLAVMKPGHLPHLVHEAALEAASTKAAEAHVGGSSLCRLVVAVSFTNLRGLPTQLLDQGDI